MQYVQCAVMSMATRFEVVLPGAPTPGLQAAAEEALRAIQETEALLSPYLATSDVWRINHHAWESPVRVSPITIGYLKTILELNRITAGTFDINVGKLMEKHGFRQSTSHQSKEEQQMPVRQTPLAEAVFVDENTHTVSLSGPEVSLDLGAVGKGIALDNAVQLLRTLGIGNAFVHGGSSSAAGLGAPPGEPGWKVEVAGPGGEDDVLAEVILHDTCLSVSTRTGRVVQHNDEAISHIVDPRTGNPINGAEVAAATCGSAAFCDAVTTALLVLGEPGPAMIQQANVGASAFVVTVNSGQHRLYSAGTAFALRTALRTAQHLG